MLNFSFIDFESKTLYDNENVHLFLINFRDISNCIGYFTEVLCQATVINYLYLFFGYGKPNISRQDKSMCKKKLNSNKSFFLFPMFD